MFNFPTFRSDSTSNFSYDSQLQPNKSEISKEAEEIVLFPEEKPFFEKEKEKIQAFAMPFFSFGYQHQHFQSNAIIQREFNEKAEEPYHETLQIRGFQDPLFDEEDQSDSLFDEEDQSNISLDNILLQQEKRSSTKEINAYDEEIVTKTSMKSEDISMTSNNNSDESQSTFLWKKMPKNIVSSQPAKPALLTITPLSNQHKCVFIPIYTYQPPQDKNFLTLSTDLRILAKHLTAQALIFLEEKGEVLLLQAQKSQKYQIEQVDNQLFAFSPSGKVYLMIDELGSGSFKITFRAFLVAAISLQKIPTAALKYRAISLTKQSKTSLEIDKRAKLNEFKLHLYLKEKSKSQDLSHVCIAKSVFTANHDQMGIITEVCHGDISDLAHNDEITLSLADSYFIAMQMASGVAQLHQVDVVHRDLKSDNFLYILEENRVVAVKLTDLGVSSHLNKELRYESRKFPFAHVDPNWHLGKNYEGIPQFLKESDIYQLGVTFYQFFTHQTVDELKDYFSSQALKLKANQSTDTDSELMRKWKQDPRLWLDFNEIEEQDVKSFLLRMLDFNIASRPTAVEVVKFFSEKYFIALQAE